MGERIPNGDCLVGLWARIMLTPTPLLAQQPLRGSPL